MFWFFIPLLIVALIIAVVVAIVAGRGVRRGGPGVRQPGDTVYDQNQQRKAPDAPPA